MEAADIASLRGVCHTPRRANDHAIPARCCTRNEDWVAKCATISEQMGSARIAEVLLLFASRWNAVTQFTTSNSYMRARQSARISCSVLHWVMPRLSCTHSDVGGGPSLCRVRLPSVSPGTPSLPPARAVLFGAFEYARGGVDFLML